MHIYKNMRKMMGVDLAAVHCLTAVLQNIYSELQELNLKSS